MANDIHQIIFVATRRAGGEALFPAESLNRLYESARDFEALGLTGMLLHNGNRLLYCLEGEEAALSRQYERIKADARVQGVAVLRQRTVEKRSFDRWGFALREDPRENQPRTLAERVVVLTADAPPEIRQTFLAFAKLDLRSSA
ncbi:MAG: BLUF domain-containing protein [Sphingobium sp.]